MARIHNQGVAAAIKPGDADFRRNDRRQNAGHDVRHDAAVCRSQMRSNAADEPVIGRRLAWWEPLRFMHDVRSGFKKTATTPAGWRNNDRVVYWGFALFGIKAQWRRSRCVLRVVETAPLCVTDNNEVRCVKPCDLRYVRDGDLDGTIDD